MFNLNVFDTVGNANKGAEIHLVNPLDDELCYLDEEKTKPVKIVVMGIKSDTARKRQLEKLKKHNKDVAKANLKRGKNNQPIENDIDYEQLIKDQCDVLAELTIDFVNLVGTDGKHIKATKEAAFNLYMNYEEIRVQVNEFVSDDANFIKD